MNIKSFGKSNCSLLTNLDSPIFNGANISLRDSCLL